MTSARQRFVAAGVPAWEAACRNNLGAVYAGQGEDPRRPFEQFQRAASLGAGALGGGHPLVAACLENLSEVHLRQGEPAEARRLLLQALAIWTSAPGEFRPRAAACLVGLGDLASRLGRQR